MGYAWFASGLKWSGLTMTRVSAILGMFMCQSVWIFG